MNMHNDSDKPTSARDALTADLESVGAAWAALSREQPPELLDQAVLNAARREAAATHRGNSRSWASPRHWLGAFATAAVLVLAVSIVIEQGEKAPAPPPPESDAQPLNGSQPAAKAERAAEADQVSRPVAKQSEQGLEQEDAAAALHSRSITAPAAAEPLPDPEAWIERLRRLKADGDAEALRAERAAFRSAFPEYPLPPDLRE